MARKRNPENPWIGYEEQARARLRDAIENPEPDRLPWQVQACMRRVYGREQVSKASLARLIAEVTGRCCSRTTLNNWLQDPGQVGPDMAEFLSYLLGFDSAEHVRTGLTAAERGERAEEYGRMDDYLEEARGYLAMLGEEGEEARASTLETLRSLAMAKRGGPKQGEAYLALARGEGLAALERLNNSRKAFGGTKRGIPGEWFFKLDSLEMSEAENETWTDDEER